MIFAHFWKLDCADNTKCSNRRCDSGSEFSNRLTIIYTVIDYKCCFLILIFIVWHMIFREDEPQLQFDLDLDG